MRKIMIVVGHPQHNTLCDGLGKAYQSAAQAAGHQAALFTLANMKFDPILHEGYRKIQSLEPDLDTAYRCLSGCDHVVLIFPLWCGDMPALMKGFIERILQPDLIARENTEHAMNWSIFKNKSARIIMTLGMPIWIYRYWYGAHALKLLSRNILTFIGIRPVRHTMFGMVGTSKPERRERWIEQVRQLGQQAA